MTYGQQGEAFAAEYLSSIKYEILERNYACKTGEIDIIARFGGTLVFVEVKARAYAAFGGPLGAVGKAKQDKIAKAASNYIKERRPSFDSVRFDIITIIDTNLDHVQNAFLPPRGSM